MADQTSSINWTPIIIVGIGIGGLYLLSSQQGSPSSVYTASGQPATIGSGIAQGTSNVLTYTGVGAGVGAAAYGIGKGGLFTQAMDTLGSLGNSIGSGLKSILGGLGKGGGTTGASSIGEDLGGL